VLGSRKRLDELAGSMTSGRGFIEQLRDGQLPQKDCSLPALSHCCHQPSFEKHFALILHHRHVADRTRQPIALPWPMAS